ncbi:protein S100-A11 [Stigmatopora nigra]
MEAAIMTLVNQFKTYAGNDGRAGTLSRDEFHRLVAEQLPNFVKGGDSGAVDRLMSSLDQNSDGELTFDEFWQLLGKLASQRAA